jgi:hypothetical protein
MEAIRFLHADFYDLPDETRYNASANSSNKIKILEEEVTIDDCKQSLQTISPILEGETDICKDMIIRLSTSLPILEGCLNVTCVQCENGKSISPIDCAQPTMAHDADTD